MELASESLRSAQAKYGLQQKNLAPHRFTSYAAPTEIIGLFEPCSPFVQNHCSSWVKPTDPVFWFAES
jgi:hypothetical protein